LVLLQVLEEDAGDDVTEPAIEIQTASLAYRLARSSASSLKEYLIKLVKGQVTYEQFWALKDVSLSVARGEVFGVVGPNGAGKSTLMKMIARVLPPTKGRVLVRGSVAPLIELGAGFNPDLTGFENIVLYGTLLGRSDKEMRLRAAEIAHWADLGDFLDVPIRSYSSGMLARLGFAVATDVHHEILIVDEVLSVGDASFQHKSKQRILSMIDGGCSVVFVSHDLPTMVEIADRVMWLDHGYTVMQGEPKEVVEAYQESVARGDAAEGA
jgi:ABC-2 type transport system ATP-binding protein/lipopolysaccharide transport system ATP-binding protein